MEVASCLLLCVVTVLLGVWLRGGKCRLPGPPQLPIIGNLLQMDMAAPHKCFVKWAKKYGPLFQVNILGERIIVVNSFELIKEVLQTRGAEFSGRPDKFRITQYTHNTGYGFSQPDAAWKALRKATFKGVRSYGSHRSNMNLVLGEIMSKTFVQIEEQHVGRAVDYQHLIYRNLLHSILAFLIGQQMEHSEEIIHLGERLDHLALKWLLPGGPGAELDVFPWLRHLGHPMWKKFQELDSIRDRLWELLLPMIRQESSLEENSIAQLYWKVHGEGQLISEERIKVSVGDLLIAGTITTTYAIYTLINVLIHHPHVQARIQREIDCVIANSEPDLDDMDSMPYMRAVIFELFRYYPNSPLNLPHAATADNVMLQGYHIPKDATILTNIYAVHYDEEFWRDPREFRPERFLDDEGQVLPPCSEERRRIITFSMGNRICPGKKFALDRIFLFMANLLKNYNLKPETDLEHQPSCSPETFEMSMALEPNPHKCVLERR